MYKDLEKGDILLYNADGIIPWLIHKLDGKEVNHAALYLGNNRVAEARSDLLDHSFEESLNYGKNNWVKVFRAQDNSRDMDKVVQRAEYYLHESYRYGYEQIFLLIFIGLTRKVNVCCIKYILKYFLEKAAALLLKFTDGNKNVMICSEFVNRCYHESGNDLGLTIGNTAKQLNTSEPFDKDSIYAILKENYRNNKKIIDNTYMKKIENIAQNIDLATLEETVEKDLDNIFINGELNENFSDDTSIDEINEAFEIFLEQFNTQQDNNNKNIFDRYHFLDQYVESDFVTPANLYNAESLHCIKQIKRVH